MFCFDFFRYYSPTILKMAGIVDNHTAIGFGAVIAFGNFIFTLVGLFLVERIGRRKLILSSLTGVIGSLSLLGSAFVLLNDNSPPTSYITPQVESNTSTNGLICMADTRCKWMNCDDCVIDDYCTFCTLNSSFGDSNSVSICVHRDSDFYNTTTNNCQIPAQFHGDYCHADDTVSLESFLFTNESGTHTLTQTDNISTYQFCPSPFSWLTITSLCFYIISFSPGMGPVPWTVNAEIYPNWARSIGNSASSTTNWISNLIVSMTFLHLARYLTRYATFWLYTCIAIGGWIFIYLLLPETNRKTLEEVEGLFQGSLCPPPGVSATLKTCMHSKQRHYRFK